jgi:acetyltransferase-like isoleucine patch superfamily enzyme
MSDDVIENLITPPARNADLQFERYLKHFMQMPIRDKRLTVLGVLRYYLRFYKFDEHGPAVLHRGVLIGKQKPASLVLGRGVRIARHCVLVVGTGKKPAELVIGPRTIVGPYTRIMAATQVRIGARCMISWNCSIFDSIGHRLWLKDFGEAEIEAPISIGDDVWIGPYSIIMKGVTIGNNCVIGAGSVIRRDVPPDSLIFGNPARVSGKVDRWER